MAKILLIQLDGKLPNLALMRLSAWHKSLGDFVELRKGRQMEQGLFDSGSFDHVYASSIFTKTRPLTEQVKLVYPHALIGGTGWDMSVTLESLGIPEDMQIDYSIYPNFEQSLGFTQRGCRLKCGFCVVPKKEGKVRTVATIHDIWRGDGHPREVVLLDNDFFGQEQWRDRINEIRDGGFKVSFNQGINVRFITDESASAIASVDYRDDSMKVKRIYTAWDNRKDESRMMDGLECLKKHGIKPDYIMVYMLIGYWPGETDQDWEYRRTKLREFGARPYPMPYERNSLSVGFQRFCIGAYDKKHTWAEFKAAKCQPANMTKTERTMRLPVIPIQMERDR